MRRLRVVLLVMGGFLTACGGGAAPVIPMDADVAQDVLDAAPGDFGQDRDAVADLGDLEAEETALDSLDIDVWYEAGDAQEADAAGQCPGGPWCPCETNDECFSGFCVETMEGKVCSAKCATEEDCPQGWVCAQYAGSGIDLIYVCVDPFKDLCKPCKEDADCERYGGGKNYCIEHGPGGRFCGVACSEDAPCPEGYECLEIPQGDRGPVQQCVPEKGGECPCTGRFKDAGYTTVCYVENEYGKCLGQRTCDGECDAATPQPETCNLLDDDCDGVTDEDLEKECPIENEFGTCPGTTLCVNGQEKCMGEPAKPETCDGVDNDCDGETDEDFPDTDEDGVADCVDTDKDGDGVADVEDNCPDIPNPDQTNSDTDKLGDACDDNDDNDLFYDEDDNCPLVKNNDQVDTDGDGKGDVCDTDDDDDGWPDASDCKPLDPNIHPNAPEICDGLDNDCSGQPDEGCSYVGFDMTPVVFHVSQDTFEVSFGGGPLGGGTVQTPKGDKYLVEMGLYPSGL